MAADKGVSDGLRHKSRHKDGGGTPSKTNPLRGALSQFCATGGHCSRMSGAHTKEGNQRALNPSPSECLADELLQAGQLSVLR